MLLLKIFTCSSLLFIKKENRQLNMAAFSFFWLSVCYFTMIFLSTCSSFGGLSTTCRPLDVRVGFLCKASWNTFH